VLANVDIEGNKLYLKVSVFIVLGITGLKTDKIHLPREVITLAAAVNTIQTKNIAAGLIVLKYDSHNIIRHSFRQNLQISVNRIKKPDWVSEIEMTEYFLVKLTLYFTIFFPL
jgi:uncharacterized membrane protein